MLCARPFCGKVMSGTVVPLQKQQSAVGLGNAAQLVGHQQRARPRTGMANPHPPPPPPPGAHARSPTFVRALGGLSWSTSPACCRLLTIVRRNDCQESWGDRCLFPNCPSAPCQVVLTLLDAEGSETRTKLSWPDRVAPLGRLTSISGTCKLFFRGHPSAVIIFHIG